MSSDGFLVRQKATSFDVKIVPELKLTESADNLVMHLMGSNFRCFFFLIIILHGSVHELNNVTSLDICGLGTIQPPPQILWRNLFTQTMPFCCDVCH